MPPAKRSSKPTVTEIYQHPEADSPMRPEVGTQAQFKKKKPPQTYRFDSSLSPELEWDGQNPAREQGEAQLSVISNQLLVIRRELAALLEKTTDPALRKLITDSLITDHLPKAEEA